jgi:hypothetical protein
MTKKSMTCKPCLGMEGLIITNWVFPPLSVSGLLSQTCKALQVGIIIEPKI